ncbi:uncharacterized protein BO97DRAFT_243321 [Aspergillus homomorphus CBS 101889]|uniref:Uncharacterized protein n=1 Tax=Aspergillus homomorphus (strain CBS 101889) TaxID=1450537 RepID=A0A395HJ86_ASPHC|nr:hypothetical protein BO97DRAFT_243321 [Aspergillus homomorphus CBS 101889]RAL07696.1 hypothetical protein BO97DRAFT_243321 [Aspergillus homomorphus CBS 101889]
MDPSRTCPCQSQGYFLSILRNDSHNNNPDNPDADAATRWCSRCKRRAATQALRPRPNPPPDWWASSYSNDNPDPVITDDDRFWYSDERLEQRRAKQRRREQRDEALRLQWALRQYREAERLRLLRQEKERELERWDRDDERERRVLRKVLTMETSGELKEQFGSLGSPEQTDQEVDLWLQQQRQLQEQQEQQRELEQQQQRQLEVQQQQQLEQQRQQQRQLELQQQQQQQQLERQQWLQEQRLQQDRDIWLPHPGHNPLLHFQQLQQQWRQQREEQLQQQWRQQQLVQLQQSQGRVFGPWTPWPY